ncbi:Assimilatory ferredoxin-dependent nitrite reductase [ANME-1 cluster archaeon GoMg1]|nr:Assimilatory ferredoxin-dependent nitrite reductase [ANME-1 cluster archaeon GoMg1]VUT25181.1 MAG: ferredoxin-nitrite reductase [Candidatus Methanolliviera sp. GoM_asphalt]
MREEKKKDLLEKGAIIQRDYETYAIAPHIPGGICEPSTLRRIADVAEKYNAATLKLTSAQRIAIVGVAESDIEDAWRDLDIPLGYAIGLCVRSVKFCPGTTFCKRGKQDSVTLGMEFDRKYHGMTLPSKFKIGVSGCTNSCAESWIKDLGFIGMPKGGKVVVGGSAGASPAIAEVLAANLNDGEAMELADKIINYYKNCDAKKRLGRYIKEVGFEEFKKEVL